MKSEVKQGPAGFKPVELKITLETQEEVDTVHAFFATYALNEAMRKYLRNNSFKLPYYELEKFISDRSSISKAVDLLAKEV